MLNESFYKYEEGIWNARFYHWFEENPFFDSSTNRGYCIVDQEEVKGVIFTIPSRLIFGDDTYIAHNISTWYVDEGYRKKSISLLFKAIEDKQKIYFSTTIVKEQMKLTEAFGFKNYNSAETVKAKLVPINLLAIMSFKIFNRPFHFNALTLIGKWIYCAVGSSSKYEVRKELTDQHKKWFRPNHESRLTNDRDMTTMEWILKSPFHKIEYFGIYYEGKQVGMMLWKHIEKGVKMIECIDYCVSEDYEDDIQSNISSIIKQVIKQCANTISGVLVPDICGIKSITAVRGILITRQEFNNKYYLTKNQQINTLVEQNRFHFTNQGDMNL